MVHKMLLWGGFGIAVRLWQLSIEMRPLFNRSSLWVYPVYAGIGSSVGYWLLGVEQRQVKFLTERRESLLERRRRRALQDGGDTPGEGGEGGIVNSVRQMMASGDKGGVVGADRAVGRSGVELKPEEGGRQQKL